MIFVTGTEQDIVWALLIGDRLRGRFTAVLALGRSLEARGLDIRLEVEGLGGNIV